MAEFAEKLGATPVGLLGKGMIDDRIIRNDVAQVARQLSLFS